MLGKASWYSIDVSANDRHILLFYKKFHFCHLLPFAKVGQITVASRNGIIHAEKGKFGGLDIVSQTVP